MADNTKSVLPAITGNALADTNIRYAAAIIGAAIVGFGVSWAKARGWHVPDADTLKLYGQLVGGVVLLVGAWIAGNRATISSQAAVVNSTVKAALTGEVPANVAAKASPEQVAAVVASPTATIQE